MTVKICDCEGECCKDSCHCGSTCLPSCSGGEKCKCDHSTGSPQYKSCGEKCKCETTCTCEKSKCNCEKS
ncbi:XXYS1_4_G0029720.mRNA.1.CDS.1 [Saccharomyces cerevisiae]|nr:EM14S01-3B_G0027200.mRNA.1.CDS.1 [Saccharomyces cerevisiae]CAD6647177.1 XXYS1_4_G0029720.mRNA.1.CDS.1 [Saccharomyces cerevisiae]CAI4780789.1 AMH_1a_G0049070.mRNA.1.CDS.1 [Saccharomyces cerevisiae]CAI6877701.1 AMH_1a_G0049070.mRNA.1.CDS.1 [Saccharomyces cerevisiae]